MMGSSRTNEKGKGPAYANIKIEEIDDYPNNIDTNVHAASGVSFGDGNFDGDAFDFLKVDDDMLPSIPSWGDIHQSVAQGIPESIEITNPNSFENLQVNLSSNTANTDFQGVSLLPEWNMGWGQQYMDQGKRPMSAGGISTFSGESSFGTFNRAPVNRDISGSSFRFQPRETAAPVHTRTNVNFDSSQCGVQGKVEGNFLRLGIGGGEEAISRDQRDNTEVSDKLKEATSAELKLSRVRHAANQTLDADFLGFQRNVSGFSNQFSNVDQRKLTNNEIGNHSTRTSGTGSSPHQKLQMQQNDMQHGRNLRSGDLDRYRADKLKEAASTELKMARARQAMGQTLDADFMGFQGNSSDFSNQFSHVGRMTSTDNAVGVHSTLNSGTVSSPHHILQMQQNDMQHGSNIRSVDLDRYRAFVGNQAVYPGTLGGNSTRFLNSHQHNLNSLSPTEFVNPSWLASYMPSEQLQNTRLRTANSLPSECSMNSTQQNNAGQLLSQNAMPTQVLGSNLLSQRTAAPQVSWVGSGSASTDEPFPKRLGVEFSGRNSPQAAHRHPSPMGTSLQATSTGQHISQHAMPTQVLGGSQFSQRTAASSGGHGPASTGEPFPQRLGFEYNGRNSPQAAQRHPSPMGTSFQATSTGQICQFPDKGSTRLPEHVVRPSIGRADGAPVNYPLNYQPPFFAHGQSQVAMTQLPMDPRGAASANASTVRPHLKRTAAVPHPASHWVQCQRIPHTTLHHSVPNQPPTMRDIHHSMLNPSPTVCTIPVTTALVHRPIPGASQTQPSGSVAGSVAARIHPSIPRASHFRPDIPVTTAPTVSHVTRKDPDVTPKLTGYKCLLCKRDLALTSEGAVYQPAAPPPVAVLPCGHTFHDQCLENITPKDQTKDPPCIPCAIGEN